MKHSLKTALTLLIALLIALPTFAFAGHLAGEGVQTEAVEGERKVAGDAGNPVQPAGTADGAVIARNTVFSDYTVEFHYDQKEYVLEGDSSVALSEILQAVGLPGEVTAVESSDGSLFSADIVNGEWIVTAHRAFSTREWMKATVNGVAYEITVTDDGATYTVTAGELPEYAAWKRLNSSTLTAGKPVSIAAGSQAYISIEIAAAEWELGYRMVSLVLTDGEGHETEITTNWRGENLFTAEPESVSQTNSNVLLRLKFDMPAADVTLSGRFSDTWIHTWADLQTALSRGGDVILMVDVAAGPDDGALVIPAGTTVNLNLNGRTLDRGLSDSDAREDGSVIVNNGTLTVTGSGVITGGFSSGNGGGIVNNGTLNLYGGSITGNRAGAQGGGILQNGTMRVSGAPVVSGNTVNGAANNILLCDNKTITVGGPLTEGASLYVTGARGNITGGYGTHNGDTVPTAYFHTDDAAYGIFLKGAEAYMEATDMIASFVERSWNGSQVVAENRVTNEVTPVPANGAMTSGWYYLNRNVTVNGRISLTGDTWLILRDGSTLDVKGIYIPQGSTLTIYGQSSGTGKIDSHPSEGAAIGATSDNHPGGTVVIHGGTIVAKGHGNCAGIGSNDGNGTTSPIVIYGGKITAEGGKNGAGIGGGRDCDGGTIAIYGGEITAKGGENGAGVGGGDGGNGSSDEGSITIYGGTVTADSEGDGAGVGGGCDGEGGNIFINGGFVIANSNDTPENGAGIGGGDGAEGGTITINGGKVHTYRRDGAGIGGGDGGKGGTITVNDGIVWCYDMGEAHGAGIGGGSDSKGGTITINGGRTYVYFRDGAGIGGGDGADGGTINIRGGYIKCEPAIGSRGNGAGIGGGGDGDNYHSGDGGDGGTITITGGEIHATSWHGAGIGGGRAPEEKHGDNYESGNGGTINITGGRVYAHSDYAFGIGAGGQMAGVQYDDEDPSAVRIGTAGRITIGGNAYVKTSGRLAGMGGDGGTINIQGGTVITKGSEGDDWGRGIWFLSTDQVLDGESTRKLNISGGNVEAIGYDECPGISSEQVTIRITGGTVYAYSPEGPAIGHEFPRGGKVSIEGGSTVITAWSDEDYAFRGPVSFSDGITLETYSGGKGSDKKVFYEGSRFTAGPDKEHATVLPATERQSAHSNSNYKYIRIEPCSHEGTIVEGVCTACYQGDVTGSGLPFVKYSWNGGLVRETDYVPEDANAFPEEESIPGGWYYVNRNVTIDGRVSLQGDTWLVLCDGYTLDVEGLYIPQGKTLTVYGQSNGTGKLISIPSEGGAGIGATSDNHPGGNIVIHGGVIITEGDDHCAGIGSNDGNGSNVGSVTIYNGDITATGGSQAAGIGGGRDCDGGTITIYGGIINATGKDSSAGIGGGDASGSRADTSTISIYGGEITATGNSKGAGIGGGEYGSATIEIHDGHVIATGGTKGGAGIGSGVDGAASTVTIMGGTVYASAGSGGAGIGDGKNGSGSTITLGWTDDTRDAVSIDASSYSGSVTLTESFYNRAGMFLANAAPDLAAMADSPLLAWGGTAVFHWEDLQAQINATANGGVITLESDCFAETGDTALQIVNGRNITIDLNGHVLNRNLLAEAAEQGSVFYVDGTSSLTINDSAWGGALTGGNNPGNGGGIYCAGTVTINGGSIRNNRAASGGGVYLEPGATLHMNGGTIEGNTCGTYGGGVYVSDAASMTVSGNPVVISNTISTGGEETDSDVFLMGNAVIGVTGELVEYGASIYVSRNGGPGVITSGYGEHNTEHPASYFRTDSPEFSVVLSDSEARIDTSVGNVPYISYAWAGQLTLRENNTDNKWIAWPGGTDIPGGMYVLNEDVTENGRVLLQGDTQLILCDGCTLDVKGLYIPQGKTLTVYGQSEGTGRITSSPSAGAAIGGYSNHDNGAIVIHGGTIEANGADHCAGIGSNDGRTGGAITIYHGTITARGGSDGAAIGGGRNCSGGTITIYGGNITANGPDDSDCCENGAGIGGGDGGDGGTITIHSGTVTAYSRDGAGIGGGDEGDGGNITIHGGTVTSTKVNQGQGARIGGGCDAAPGTIAIDGGSITTVGGSGAGIGGGKRNTGGGTVTINGGTISASGDYCIGSGEAGSDVDITLGYTDASRDSVSITIDAPFGGTVTLNQPFQNWNGVRRYLPGVASDRDRTEYMYNSPLVAWDGQITDWERLQFAIDAAESGSTISLTGNITATSSDQALQIPEGKHITIDLCGFTIDRHLSSGNLKNDACVIINDGSLTIADSAGGGRITGGYNAGIDPNASTKNCGGGICNRGTLTLNGGTISGNTCGGWGGGIYLAEGAILNLNGGLVKNNNCGSSSNGGGIHVSEGAVLNVSGNPVVWGNKKGDTFNNVNLAAGETIHVSGPLGDTASIGVSVSAAPAAGAPRVLTDGLPEKGALENFISDSEAYGIGLNPDGEAQLCVFHSVTVAPDIQHGYVSVDRKPANYVEGWTVVLMAEGDEDYILASLTVANGDETVEYAENENGTYTFTMPDADVTVTAVFAKGLHSVVIDPQMQNGTIAADPESAVEGTPVTLSVSPNEEYFLSELNVKNGDEDVEYEEGEANTYIFVMPAADVTVTATFTRTYRITTDTVNGTVQPDKETAPEGEVIALTAEPDDGYLFVEDSFSVTRDDTGETVPVNDDNTFIMPGAPVTVSAEFESLPQELTASLAGEEYGSYTVTVNGGEPVVLSGNEGGLRIPGVRTGDTITVTFQPGDNGCIYEFYIEDSTHQEMHYEGEILDNAFTFIMPAESRRIFARFVVLNPVVTVSYVDEDGVGHTVEAAALTGEEYKEFFDRSLRITLGRENADTWYFVNKNIVYTSEEGSPFKTILSLKGHVHLIIADGKTLTVQDRITHNDYVAAGRLSVYGQARGTGRLVSGSFEAGGVSICSAAYETGSISSSAVDIRNGSLTVSGNVSCGDGTLNITGGTTNIAGQATAGTIILGCRTMDDSITIGSIVREDPSWQVSVFGNQALTDGSRAYSGSLPDQALSDMAGKTLWYFAFGNPDFVIPNGTTTIEANAFEGIAATVVEISVNCRSIGDYAFKDCGQLTQIRIPVGCTLGKDVFDGCEIVYIFGVAGSDAERYCSEHKNCVFVADAQE